MTAETKPRLVMKFGGTSVADLDRIRNAAVKVKREVDRGYDVTVVVSAMSGRTNELVGWVREAARPADADHAGLYDAREYDAVVASGEQVTSGLMALVLQEMGVPARSWQGWQIPIRTSGLHGAARIEAIETEAMVRKFGEGLHAVVAGFQGIGPDGRIATLGRGGSDTTAVALAAALGAERCDIYTDVDGVYTTDPRIERRARKLERIAYEEMLELASLGAKVLQTRSVELAMRYKVRLMVLSSFEDLPGTLVCDEEEIMEQNVVSGVAFSRDEAKLTLVKVNDQPGVAARIFGPLSENGVNVDMIVQNIGTDLTGGEDGTTDMTFSVALSEVERARAALEAARGEIGYEALIVDDEVAKVSVVGIGMRSNAGVAQRMFAALAEEGINIKVIATSEIKVSVLIDRWYLELAVRALHEAFGLEAA
ncbi:aspartate kinase [Paralimibaculum aggregatum]|uniref:Aspartokinase n=1 Tax=Paralimibaculum aggregatum TaxID=3036245 RepID=A0ABQ6LJW0_9RHOB|nr:aspartate kinase [Limibaculum sp. NKW23]GMG80954.1 aspartate kinase [Limibaculum sp. NKW23]